MSSAAIKIIHNRKLSMTPEEYQTYDNICKSYDRQNFKGQDLFQDLFESDKYGNITLIRPPSKQTSMEVFLFIVALYEQQGRRILEANEEKRLSDLTKKFEQRIEELTAKYENKLKELQNQ